MLLISLVTSSILLPTTLAELGAVDDALVVLVDKAFEHFVALPIIIMRYDRNGPRKGFNERAGLFHRGMKNNKYSKPMMTCNSS